MLVAHTSVHLLACTSWAHHTKGSFGSSMLSEHDIHRVYVWCCQSWVDWLEHRYCHVTACQDRAKVPNPLPGDNPNESGFFTDHFTYLPDQLESISREITSWSKLYRLCNGRCIVSRVGVERKRPRREGCLGDCQRRFHHNNASRHPGMRYSFTRSTFP